MSYVKFTENPSFIFTLTNIINNNIAIKNGIQSIIIIYYYYFEQVPNSDPHLKLLQVGKFIGHTYLVLFNKLFWPQHVSCPISVPKSAIHLIGSQSSDPDISS